MTFEFWTKKQSHYIRILIDEYERIFTTAMVNYLHLYIFSHNFLRVLVLISKEREKKNHSKPKVLWAFLCHVHVLSYHLTNSNTSHEISCFWRLVLVVAAFKMYFIHAQSPYVLPFFKRHTVFKQTVRV